MAHRTRAQIDQDLENAAIDTTEQYPLSRQ